MQRSKQQKKNREYELYLWTEAVAGENYSTREFPILL